MDERSEIGLAITRLVGSNIAASRRVGGGDFATAYRLDLDDGRSVFAKTHTNPPINFFDTEARGLSWLRSADALPVPAVLAASDEPPVLVLEWIDETSRPASDEAVFGAGLAALHAAGADCFGRQDRRTTGSRALPNEPCDTWSDFYATQRLLPLARLARDNGTYHPNQIAIFEKVAERLTEIGGPPEPAARLHGDLWAGNRLVDAAGTSWIIDPASHGGHREFDLAMMRLFGGFGDAAFSGYNDVSPLGDGWQERVRLHQLPPLLVHAIKFGGSYVETALAAARHYV